MSNLVEHARRELELLGQTDQDPGFSESIIAAVEAFTSFPHSGWSAMVARKMLAKLLNREALSPLTDHPDEWDDKSQVSGYQFWQNVRDTRAFSEDGGKTYFLLGDPTIRHSEHREKVTTPETITLPPETAEILYDEVDIDGYEYVTDQRGETSRWRQHMILVIRRTSDGKLFGANYQRGLTENCDSSYPWSDGRGAEFREMEQYEKTVSNFRYRRTA